MIRFETSFGTVSLKFRHQLPYVEVNQNNDLVSMVNNLKIHQGKTEAILEVVSGPVVDEFNGFAYTHPSDLYKKGTGRVLALKRAIEAAVLTDKQSREVMAGYYSR